MGFTEKRLDAEVGSRRLYECDGCGTVAPWGDDWSWYGSCLDLENEPETVLIFCGDACRETAAGKQAIRKAKARG